MNNAKRKFIRKHKLVTDRVKHEDSRVLTLLLPKAHYSRLQDLCIIHGVTVDCLIRSQIKHLLFNQDHMQADTLYFRKELDEAKRSAQDV